MCDFVHCTTFDEAWVGDIHSTGKIQTNMLCQSFLFTFLGHNWWCNIHQDQALGLTCLGGYLGGAEAKPRVGQLPLWPTSLKPQDNHTRRTVFNVQTRRYLFWLQPQDCLCSYKTKSLLSKTPPQNHRDSSGPYLKNPKIETHPTHGELPLSSGQLITQLDSLPAEANPSHWSHFSKLASFTLNTRA